MEYLLVQYLGKPTRRGSPGESFWPCPVCEHPKFHTMPVKPPFKHRAKCWNRECGFRGDEKDMLKAFHPNEPYGDRLDRFERLREEWDARNREEVGENQNVDYV